MSNIYISFFLIIWLNIFEYKSRQFPEFSKSLKYSANHLLNMNIQCFNCKFRTRDKICDLASAHFGMLIELNLSNSPCKNYVDGSEERRRVRKYIEKIEEGIDE